MNDKLYKIIRFGCHLPIVRSVVNGLYHIRYHWACTDRSADEARKTLHSLHPRPTGTAYWQMPVGGEDRYDLSVIVPFYKTEQYAQECIGSVLSQVTDYRVEVILVDDGSPDRCGEILDSYASREHVKVIHQINQGVAAARNTGIAAAEGTYVMFVDSDDYLAEGAIQSLMQAAAKHNADIAEGSFHSVSPDGNPRLTNIHKNAVTARGVGLYGYPWGKVIRRTLFQSVCFPTGYWYEDAVIGHLIYPLSGTTVTVEPIVLNYRHNPVSLSRAHGGNPKTLHALYISECLLNAITHNNALIDDISRELLLRELGPVLLMRTQALGRSVLEAEFVVACELVERYQLIPEKPSSDPMMNELRSAFWQRQFHRWLWASFLI